MKLRFSSLGLLAASLVSVCVYPVREKTCCAVKGYYANKLVFSK